MLRNSTVRLWKLIARCFFWMAGFRFLAARLDRALVGESTPSAALKREPHTAWQVSTSMRGSELPQRPKPKKCHQTIAQVADVAPEAGADGAREAAHAAGPPPHGRNVLQRSKRKPSGNKSSAFSPEKADPPPATGTPAQTRRQPAGRKGSSRADGTCRTHGSSRKSGTSGAHRAPVPRAGIHRGHLAASLRRKSLLRRG